MKVHHVAAISFKIALAEGGFCLQQKSIPSDVEGNPPFEVVYAVAADIHRRDCRHEEKRGMHVMLDQADEWNARDGEWQAHVIYRIKGELAKAFFAEARHNTICSECKEANGRREARLSS